MRAAGKPFGSQPFAFKPARLVEGRELAEARPDDALHEKLAEQAPGSRVRPLYLQPLLVTAADGRATIRFSLPRDITAYRVSIDAHSDGRIGSAELQVERSHSE